MKDWITIEKDPKHIAKEKLKAQKLKKTQWWHNKISSGECYYCHKIFSAKELTMDHIVPLARGGRSNKGNLVPSCKDCNNKKKYYTPVEILLQDLHSKSSK